MLILADSLPDGVVLRCDVAIVGSGPAGLSVAAELADRQLRVLVLESGSISPSRRNRRHLEGHSSGAPFPIGSSRDSGFGGSSRLWRPATGLRVRRLDHIDFGPLAARAGQTWPFGAEELEPFYQRAGTRLGIRPDLPDIPWKPGREDASGTGPDGPRLAMFQFLGNEVFLRRFGEVSASPWIELLAEATVRSIDVAPDTGEVRCLEAISSRKTRFRVEARRYVLACGAIENARLLLDSAGLTGRGVGNEHDQVGRWFMDHLSFDAGLVVSNTGGAVDTSPFREQTLASGGKYQTMLWVGESEIRRNNLLNAAFWVYQAEPTYLSPGVESARYLREGLLATPKLPQARAHLLRVLHGSRDLAAFAVDRAGLRRRAGPVVLRALTEQVPDRSSQVVLNDRRDSFGRRRVTLNWRVSTEEIEQVYRHQRLLAEHFRRGGMGEIVDFLPADRSLPLVSSNHHHVGGTRMHSDPKHGVVDAQCRVHSARNLFIAGGSVFPTGGYVNPTFTIVAIAIRTADVIQREL